MNRINRGRAKTTVDRFSRAGLTTKQPAVSGVKVLHKPSRQVIGHAPANEIRITCILSCLILELASDVQVNETISLTKINTSPGTSLQKLPKLTIDIECEVKQHEPGTNPDTNFVNVCLQGRIRANERPVAAIITLL
jgi:hypothetical protein